MLRECGLTTATTSDGREFTFRPSFGRIAALGHPHEIVSLYAALFGPHAETEATYVLAVLCDQGDEAVRPLIGCFEADADPRRPLRRIEGEMPPAEQVLVARHLMQHGMVGTARPDRGGEGQYSDRF